MLQGTRTQLTPALQLNPATEGCNQHGRGPTVHTPSAHVSVGCAPTWLTAVCCPTFDKIRSPTPRQQSYAPADKTRSPTGLHPLAPHKAAPKQLTPFTSLLAGNGRLDAHTTSPPPPTQHLTPPPFTQHLHPPLTHNTSPPPSHNTSPPLASKTPACIPVRQSQVESEQSILTDSLHDIRDAQQRQCASNILAAIKQGEAGGRASALVIHCPHARNESRYPTVCVSRCWGCKGYAYVMPNSANTRAKSCRGGGEMGGGPAHLH